MAMVLKDSPRALLLSKKFILVLPCVMGISKLNLVLCYKRVDGFFELEDEVC